MMKKHIFFYSLLIISVIILSCFLINTNMKYTKLTTEYNTLLNEHTLTKTELDISKETVANKDLELLNLKNETEKITVELTTVKKERDQLKSELTKIKNTPKPSVAPVQTNTVQPIEGKVAYLTFDDGPSKNTITILDTLKEHNIKATFFINGNYNKDIVQRIINEGHAIGNHTTSHNYKTIYASKDAFLNDFKSLEDNLANDFQIRPIIMRFPGGSNNTVSHKYGGKNIMTEIIGMMTDNGYKYFDWNVTSGDADSTPATKEQIVNNVVNRSKNLQTPIILMHDAASKTETAKAVPEIINQLKTQGFSFDKLSENSPTVHFK